MVNDSLLTKSTPFYILIYLMSRTYSVRKMIFCTFLVQHFIVAFLLAAFSQNSASPISLMEISRNCFNRMSIQLRTLSIKSCVLKDNYISKLVYIYVPLKCTYYIWKQNLVKFSFCWVSAFLVANYMYGPSTFET